MPYSDNEDKKAWKRAKHDKIRMAVIAYYSEGLMECSCCGDEHLEFLCIDHIEGGGTEFRRGHRGPIYEWLAVEGFPVGYRVLCCNCNSSYGLRGYCPHQKEGRP